MSHDRRTPGDPADTGAPPGRGPILAVIEEGVQMHAGIDSHTDTLAVAMVDDSGRKVATATVANERRL